MIHPLSSVISSARYLVSADGTKTDVVLSLSAWEELIVWLEELDDRATVQEWLPRLKKTPIEAGALRWNQVAAEWDDDKTI